MADDMLWNRESTLELIGLYEMHPNLYNSADCNYMNRVKRAESLNAICDGMKDFIPQITVDAIRRKVHTLRNQFIREYRLVEKSKKSGASHERIYEPKLWCYDELFFLKTFFTTRSSVCNIQDKSNSSSSVPINCLSEEDCTPKRRNSLVGAAVGSESLEEDYTPKRKNSLVGAADSLSSLEHWCCKGLERVAVLLEEKITTKSSYSWLGQQVIFEMDNIKDERIRRKTSWAIQKILQESVEEDLALRNENSSSSVPTNTPSTSKPNPYKEIVFEGKEVSPIFIKNEI